MPAVEREGEGVLKAVSLCLGFIVSVWGRRPAPRRRETTNIHFVIFAKAALQNKFGDGLQTPSWITLSSCSPVPCWCINLMFLWLCSLWTGYFLYVFYGAFMENASAAPSLVTFMWSAKSRPKSHADLLLGYLFTEHSWGFIALHAFLKPQRYLSINSNIDMCVKDKLDVVFSFHCSLLLFSWS